MAVRNKATGFLLFGGAVAAAAFLGGRFNPSSGGTREWYAALEKPPFNPPDWIFAPVWTLLYVLIAWSGARIWNSAESGERTTALRLWWTQLLLNASWSPTFFGARRPDVSLVIIVLMLIAIGTYAGKARRVDAPAAWMMAPYLAWVSFATLLNEEMVRLN